MHDRAWDVVTFGRTSMDLYGRQAGTLLRDMAGFAKSVGGTPANVAVGCARLGLRAAVITAVGADAFGDAVRAQLSREGVECRGVRRDPARPTALAFAGVGPGGVVELQFWRENCADLGLGAADLDAGLLQGTKALVLTGTHLSTQALFEVSLQAAAMARGAGARLVLDIDDRPGLWPAAERQAVPARLQAVLAQADLVCGTEAEWCAAASSPDVGEALRRLRGQSAALFIVKRGAAGAWLVPGDTARPAPFAAWPVETVNPLGAGDAFLAGFLSLWLRGGAAAACMARALACGAIAAGRLLCASAYPGLEELGLFMAGRKLHDPAVTAAHRRLGRVRPPASLRALAIDHRPQFAGLTDDPDKVRAFKRLALAAVAAQAAGRPGYGLLLDHEYGNAARAAPEAAGLWLAAPVERPFSRPLAFAPGADLGTALESWPAGEALKCLVSYHPDDPPALRDAQDEALRRLQAAALATGRDYVLEVLPPASAAQNPASLPGLLTHFYGLGLRPDWWKLPLQPAATWRALAAVIAAHDPGCQGMLVLGSEQKPEDLAAGLAEAAACPGVCGFAIGRAIWAGPAAAWFAGTADAAQTRAALQANFAGFVRVWEQQRGAA